MFSIGRRNVRRGCCPVQVCSNAHSAGKRFRTITTSPIMSSTNFPRCRSSTCAWGRARGCRTQHKCRLGEGHRAQAYQYRTGTDADAPQIQKIILSQMCVFLHDLYLLQLTVLCATREEISADIPQQFSPHPADAVRLLLQELHAIYFLYTSYKKNKLLCTLAKCWCSVVCSWITFSLQASIHVP